MLLRFKSLFINSFTFSHLCVKAAPTNDYGQRAHEDLIVTRGQGFRKEKNKKKKGSYRGGEITVWDFIFELSTVSNSFYL
jgi:SRP40, C-terminal domain